MINKESGHTLADVVISFPIIGLIIVILSLAMVNFVTTYQEVEAFTRMSTEMFNAIEVIRHGNVFEDRNEPNPVPLLGVLTADTLTIGLDRSLNVKPKLPDTRNYYSKFYVKNNILFADVKSGHKTKYNLRLFPVEDREIGENPEIEILNPKHIFSNRTPNLPNTPSQIPQDKICLLGVELKAKVRFRSRLDKQSVEEDIRFNTRTIRYTTRIFAGSSI